MSFRTRKIERLLVCILTLVAAACHESAALSPGAQSSAPQSPTIDDRAKSINSANAFAKPTAPIDIRYELRGVPQAGQPLEIRVSSRSRLDLSEVSMQVQGDERVFISPRSGDRNRAQLPRNEAMVRTVMVTPLVNGVLQVRILVQAEVNGKIQARSMIVPITVGATTVAVETAGAARVAENGELIISLPAQESQQ
jgi:hypothetical protein